MVQKKTRPQDVALELYLEGSMSQAEIADLIGVSERTILNWKTKGQWEKQLALRQQTPQELESDIIEIIAEIVKSRKDEKDPGQRLKLADELSKYNKIWDKLKKDSRLSLTEHITVMKDFIAFAQKHDPKSLKDILKLSKDYITELAPKYT